MTASAISPFPELREACGQNQKMLNYSGGLGGPPRVTSAPCPSAPAPGSLPHREPAGGLPGPKLSHTQFVNSLRADLTSALLGGAGGGNKENRFLERSHSEPGDGPRLGAAAAASQVNPSRYKTELCRPFDERGACKYGDRCQFAHGARELRSLSRHPKYKTEPCRTFHAVGFCPYGPRCHFVHNAEERRGPPPPPPPPLSAFNKPDSRPRLWHSVSCPGGRPWPPDSLSDQEGYQSSTGSGSPLLDASRRLPIFSGLSICDG